MADESYPPDLTPEQLSFLISTFTDYSLANGLVVRPAPSFIANNPNNSLATPAPVTLWPSPFPARFFTEAREIQQACNLLYARVANDEEWLGELTQELALVDEFIANLWAVHVKLKDAGENGYKHKYSLGLFRSDYMVHTEGGGKVAGIRQVEFNTIASSFGALAQKVSELHRYLWRSGTYPPTRVVNDSSLPKNSALEELAEGLAGAHEVYISDISPGSDFRIGNVGPEPQGKYGIIFVVQDGERNAFDQRWLEYHITTKYGIKVFRATLSDIKQYAKHGKDSQLLYSPPEISESAYEISVVYFRAGYGPGDYPTQEQWDTRYFIEQSRAIKCPTILTQLAGSKKVQQVLADPKKLEKFVDSPEMKDRIFDTFAAIYPMDNSPAGLKARKLAFEEPEKYVLKPQREGGGNNIYRSKIPDFLKSIDEDKWHGYILMELIQPPEIENLVMRNGELMRGKVVGELGIYGTIIWKDNGKGDVEVVRNTEAGFLLRTKGSDSEEGGVAAGFGCIDSCLLYND